MTPAFGQDAGRVAADVSNDQRLQQPLDGDETVAGLFRGVLGRLEHAGPAAAPAKASHCRRKPWAAWQAPDHWRPSPPWRRRRHARSGDDAMPWSSSSRTFRICSGVHWGMALRKRIGLRRLQETAHPLGVFFDIHGLPPVIAQPAFGTARWFRNRLPERRACHSGRSRALRAINLTA